MKNKRLHISLSFLLLIFISCSDPDIITPNDSSSSVFSSSSLAISSSSSFLFISSSSSSYEILSEAELRKLVMYESTEPSFAITDTTTSVNLVYPFGTTIPDVISPTEIIALFEVTGDISYMGLDDAINVYAEYSYRQAPKQVFDYIGNGDFPKFFLNHGYRIYPDTISAKISTTVGSLEFIFPDIASAFIRVDVSEYPEFDSLGLTIDDLNSGEYFPKNLRDSTPYTGLLIDYNSPNNPHWLGIIPTFMGKNLYVSYTATQRSENLYLVVWDFDPFFCENQNFSECDSMTFSECQEFVGSDCTTLMSSTIRELEDDHANILWDSYPYPNY